jgi:hypothetical protein
MVWKAEDSGPIPLSSVGQWGANVLNQKHPTLSPLSVGGYTAVEVGSDRYEMTLILSE